MEVILSVSGDLTLTILELCVHSCMCMCSVAPMLIFIPITDLIQIRYIGIGITFG